MALGHTGARLLPPAVAMLGVAIGVLAAVSPLLALAAAAAIAFATLTIVDLTLGVALFAFVSFIEVLPGFGALSIAKLAGGVLVLSWIAATAASQRQLPQIASAFPGFTVVMVLFVAWVAVSLLWAEDGALVANSLQRFLPNLLLFAIMFSAVRSGRDARLILAAFVLGALISTAYGGFIASGDADAAADGRVSGAGVDPNYLAASLVASLAICVGVIATVRYPSSLRFAALLAVLVLMAALAATASRTGVVALLVATGFAVLTAGRGRRLAASLLVSLLLVGGAVYLAQGAPQQVRERLASIDTSGTGRTDIWKVATRVIEDNAVIGVGAGNFLAVSVHYLFESGTLRRSDLIVDDPKVTHNVFLGLWAELGIIGLALFVMIVGFSIRCALKAARRFEEVGDRAQELLARSVAVAMVGELVASFFVSNEYEKTLWLMLALGPSLLGLSRRSLATSHA
ncbi:MAG: O-antigen ligase family protein [Solirubrobacteraceae bacterium]